MAHVLVAEVQQWVEQTQADLGGGLEQVADLETTASITVLSALQDTYATGTWANEATTPDLVRTIIAMLTAAWFYRRSYADQLTENGNSYADKLESSAMLLLGGLVDGSNDLGTDTPRTEGQGSPAFWPTDLATTTAEQSGSDADGATPRAFSMGKVF